MASQHISLVVATRNRADALARLLVSVEALQIPAGKSLEVVVVNNGSNDHTAAVIEAAAVRGRVCLRSIVEPVPGKSRALNLGFHHASGDIVALTDDDCIPDPGWLIAFDRELAPNGTADCAGGRVLLGDPSDLPLTTLRSTVRKEISTEIDAVEGALLGCNMAVRREVFSAVDGYDTTLGPGSNTRAVSEDMDFVYRVFKAGYKILYTPDAVMYHYHGRKTKAEEAALRYQYSIGRGAFYSKHFLLKPALWWLMSISRRGARAFRQSATLKDKFHQLAGTSRLLLGAAYGALRYRFQ